MHPGAVPVAALVPLLERSGRPGFVVADMTDVAEFTPIDCLDVPAGPLYAVRAARRGAPKAGWCWAGNRHTWLGFASTAGRRGPTPTAQRGDAPAVRR
ncbi:DUF5701 family protein [Kineococcus sp. SYSU DK018]|uniref:DUF5701 family protein n=1 Tax=Kineococcus sp. SYSU DK018 TaxID=3383139 RepID=UPI003D7E15F2